MAGIDYGEIARLSRKLDEQADAIVKRQHANPVFEDVAEAAATTAQLARETAAACEDVRRMCEQTQAAVATYDTRAKEVSRNVALACDELRAASSEAAAAVREGVGREVGRQKRAMAFSTILACGAISAFGLIGAGGMSVSVWWAVSGFPWAADVLGRIGIVGVAAIAVGAWIAGCVFWRVRNR